MLWGWCPFIELIILCKHDASKLLFVKYVKCPFFPVGTNYLCADIPRYWKEGLLMSNLTPPLQRTLFECLSRKDNPCHTPMLREEEAGHWCLCHNDGRILHGKEARVVFLSKEDLGMVSVYWSECAKQKWSFQYLVFWSLCDEHSTWLYKPALCCFSTPVQARHGQAQSAISWKENMFEVPFRQWKVPEPNQCSKTKLEAICVCAILIGEVLLWKKQGLISWAMSYWGWCVFTDLLIQLKKEAVNLLFLLFVKWLFYSGCMN